MDLTQTDLRVCTKHSDRAVSSVVNKGSGGIKKIITFDQIRTFRQEVVTLYRRTPVVQGINNKQ